MATEARPAFIAITGRLEPETVAAVARFAACVRAASGERESHPIVVTTSMLAGRAFGGDREAWRPLVLAVRNLLSTAPARTAGELKSRRELRAFVAENADLLEP